MSVAMEDWPRRHRITVDEYLRMAESGVIAPDARVELIDGVIIDMPPTGIPHTGSASQLNSLLVPLVHGRAIVRADMPLQLGDDSMPEPDFVLVLPRKDFYKTRYPTAADTLLVIEVSDSSLNVDLRRKMSLYARHGIGEYWVVDVANHRLHVFRRPVDAGYEQVSCIDGAGTVEIGALPGLAVDLSPLFDS